jgi:transposase
MVATAKLNGDPQKTELAGPERREGERSEPSRSGVPANSRRPAPVDTEVLAKAQRRTFSAAYKLAIIEEADRVTDPGQIGALLRREGLYSSHLVDWRRLRESGALNALSKKRGCKPTRNPRAEENQKWKRQVARLERQLQQAQILIDVQKRVSALLGISLPETDQDGSNS